MVLCGGSTKPLSEIKIFDSEDEIIKCLIETNIRQRGIGNTNPVKFGRCLKELERIYGIKEGRPEKLPQNAEVSNTTQSDLASQFGMSVDTLNRYKQLADSIPEVQDLVETGIVTPSVARAIIKKLPEFQQKEIADKFASEGIKVPLKICDPVLSFHRDDNLHYYKTPGHLSRAI